MLKRMICSHGGVLFFDIGGITSIEKAEVAEVISIE
jgi:hypothetical protein